jgi:hypothetical protein
MSSKHNTRRKPNRNTAGTSLLKRKNDTQNTSDVDEQIVQDSYGIADSESSDSSTSSRHSKNTKKNQEK